VQFDVEATETVKTSKKLDLTVSRVNRNFSEMNNRTLLIAELGETWETLTQYELKKRELNKNIKTNSRNKAAKQGFFTRIIG
jgi:hypothetical protein